VAMVAIATIATHDPVGSPERESWCDAGHGNGGTDRANGDLRRI
jgi:hypothetical protein